VYQLRIQSDKIKESCGGERERGKLTLRAKAKCEASGERVSRKTEMEEEGPGQR